MNDRDELLLLLLRGLRDKAALTVADWARLRTLEQLIREENR